MPVRTAQPVGTRSHARKLRSTGGSGRPEKHPDPAPAQRFGPHFLKAKFKPVKSTYALNITGAPVYGGVDINTAVELLYQCYRQLCKNQKVKPERMPQVALADKTPGILRMIDRVVKTIPGFKWQLCQRSEYEYRYKKTPLWIKVYYEHPCVHEMYMPMRTKYVHDNMHKPEGKALLGILQMLNWYQKIDDWVTGNAAYVIDSWHGEVDWGREATEEDNEYVEMLKKKLEYYNEGDPAKFLKRIRAAVSQSEVRAMIDALPRTNTWKKILSTGHDLIMEDRIGKYTEHEPVDDSGVPPISVMRLMYMEWDGDEEMQTSIEEYIQSDHGEAGSVYPVTAGIFTATSNLGFKNLVRSDYPMRFTRWVHDFSAKLYKSYVNETR